MNDKYKILIWGDSWGVPNLEVPQEGFTPEGHISSLLERHGHEVCNMAKNGMGNMCSIVATLSKVHLIPDYIIWFHTEIPRDFNLPIKTDYWNYESFSSETAHKIYTAAAGALKAIGNPKLIVIEGQAPLHKSYTEYFVPDYIIKDWRSELLQKQMPYSHLVGTWDLLETPYNDDTIETKSKLVADAEYIIEKMKHNKNHFIDNCHPGNAAHMELFETLHNIIKNID